MVTRLRALPNHPATWYVAALVIGALALWLCWEGYQYALAEDARRAVVDLGIGAAGVFVSIAALSIGKDLRS